MTTYCVWFDNFMQELFALEKSEFDKYEKMQAELKNEKNIIHFINADSMKDAFDQYREKQKLLPVMSQLVH